MLLIVTKIVSDPIKIFIVGSSIVKRAKNHAMLCSFGEDLGLYHDRGVKVYWRAQGGLTTDNLVFQVSELVKEAGRPHMLLLHCGGNDIGQGANTFELGVSINSNLEFLHNTYPGTLLIWSQILPRFNWRVWSPWGHHWCDRARARVNRSAASYTLQYCHGAYIRYPELTLNNPNMFNKDDGVHLSDIGNDKFLGTLKNALWSFMDSENKVFPP